ncbi:MAG: transposase [Planctomycetota bacterium]
MPRTARIVIPECPHHVVQRGNNRQDVFFVEDDRVVYLSMLGEQAVRFGLTVQGYCLMTNHVHLVVTPAEEPSLAKAIGRTHWLYTRYINRLHGRVGHLWQNRFFSCPLDEAHLWRAIAYAERNPVRAGMVRMAWRHRWSNAAVHSGERRTDPSGLLDMAWWWSLQAPEAWREVLTAGEDDAALADFRRALHRGRPLGSDRFIAKLEHALGRRLRPPPMGRPRKKRKPQTAGKRSGKESNKW